MDRYWFITSTTYGTWLPGDPRGFVGFHRDEAGSRIIHNMPGEPFDANLPRLATEARAVMRFPAIYFRMEHAEALLTQFQETSTFRGWLLLAVAIMTWHFHLVVGVEGDPDPERILGDYKSYGSRALNRKFGKPASDTWWTASGSKRKLKTEADVAGGVQYVREQESPLVIWINPIWTEGQVRLRDLKAIGS